MKTNQKPSQTRFFVTDWNSNGTNDLLVIRDYGGLNESIYCVEEALFGIDIYKLNVDTLEDGLEVAEVDLKTVTTKLAVSPVMTAASQYKRIMQCVNGQ